MFGSAPVRLSCYVDYVLDVIFGDLVIPKATDDVAPLLRADPEAFAASVRFDAER